MKFTKILAEKININEKLLPHSYQRIGDILLIKLKHDVLKRRFDIGSALLLMYPYIKTVCLIKGIQNEFRKPKIEVISGSETKTVHKEHGILYKLDVSKIMFSKGNLFERQRLIKQIKPNETIVDMFAGIGYFSLGLAKFSKAKIIYAIEKNPSAFKLLKENIELNKIDNIKPVYGDCRQVARQKKFQNIADRIVMGYLPKTYKFLLSAFLFLKPEGIIHYHDTFVKDELWEKPVKILNGFVEKNSCKIKILSKRVVKSYAPNVEHVVIDFQIKKYR